MKMIRTLGVSVLAAALLAACGGGDDKPSYNRIVSFGDSLSDVGTYATPALVAATGGGKYTVNGPNGKVWIELIAARVGAAAPCAAQVGLESSGPLAGFASAPVTKADCFGYAQGGARVTNPVGPANKAVIALGDTQGYLGQLTVPVVTQVQRHLAAGGFKSKDLVLAWAGGNDVFMNLGAVGAGGSPTAAVTAMATAGTELANLVKTMQGQGALRIAVVLAGDINKTPYGSTLSAATQGLITTMTKAYNDALSAGLAGNTGVVLVDAYTRSQDQAANPSKYGVSNAAAPACDLVKAQLGSLSCSAATLIPGDVSKYLFADGVHPSPYGHQLAADLVMERLVAAGWF